MKKRVHISFMLIFAFLLSSITPTLSVYAADASVETVEGELEYTQDTEETEEKSADIDVSVASTFSVQIPKKVALNGETKQGNYTIGVKGDIGSNETIFVEPLQYSITLSQEGKEDISAKITQNKVAWVFSDINQDTYVTVDGTITAEEATAGEWLGTISFNIYNESGLEPGLYDENYEMIKTWNELVEDGDVTVNSYAITGANTDLTGVLVTPNTLDSINQKVFQDCINLTEVIFAQKVKFLYNDIFSGCTGLTKVIFPSNAGYFPNNICKNCINLKEVILPSKIKFIPSGAFLNCESLTTIEFPESLEYIQINAFEGCNSLTTLTFYEGFLYTSFESFKNCTSLTEVNFPNSLEFLYATAFLGCTSLNSINIPNNNIYYCSVDGIAFTKDMATLMIYPAAYGDTYTIPESVTIINQYAFYDCSNITSIILPNNLKRICYNAFINTPNLTITYQGIQYTDPALLKEALEANDITVEENYWTLPTS